MDISERRSNLSRKQLRSMAPHVVYAYAAMQEALADAALTPEMVSDPRTGLLCASAGSPRLTFHHLQKMLSSDRSSVIRLRCRRALQGR